MGKFTVADPRSPLSNFLLLFICRISPAEELLQKSLALVISVDIPSFTGELTLH